MSMFIHLFVHRTRKCQHQYLYLFAFNFQYTAFSELAKNIPPPSSERSGEKEFSINRNNEQKSVIFDSRLEQVYNKKKKKKKKKKKGKREGERELPK